METWTEDCVEVSSRDDDQTEDEDAHQVPLVNQLVIKVHEESRLTGQSQHFSRDKLSLPCRP